MIAGFSDRRLRPGPVEIAASIGGGDGPAVLLLHGFPQNRALWARVAPGLAAAGLRVIAPDLRGYGDSSVPAAVADFSFREMARDMVALMQALGHEKFHLVGHDRGARVGHRLALDAPDRLLSLTLMDIVPTLFLLERLTWPVARAYYHWFFLAQPAPLPERLIGADPDSWFESCLSGWGASGLNDFDPEQLAAYRAAWRRPEVITGMCNDYRATLEVDVKLDAADRDRQVTCPTLVMWGRDGAMGRALDVPATWADRLARMQTRAMPGGHFFIDTAPDETRAALLDFLAG